MVDPPATSREARVSPQEAQVLAAAKAFAAAKEAVHDCWVEFGHVTPSLSNTLDKATQNLLSTVAAL